MAIYRLWREPFIEPFETVDALDAKTAVERLSQKIGERLTLEEGANVAPYLMDCLEANAPAKFTRPEIPVYRCDDAPEK